ncbi:MAG: protein tyrosine phosphatase [Eubacterium sp.]|nr:protein tyrosine phosphatase [Eubacterium sp.]
MRLFDIHCHILPGVDDGSKSMDMSLDMLQIAYEEGTRQIVLTPHYMLGRNQYKANELDTLFEKLKAEAEERWPDLVLYLGNEILWEEGIMDRLRKGDIHTMNGTRYVLVEYNVQTPFRQIADSIQQLTNARYRPIIAHVERYQSLVKREDRIEEMLRMKALLQMNISSVEGGFLNESKRWCRKLLKDGYITFLGTDAHNVDSRAPYSQEYISWLKRHCGEDAQYMLTEAAEDMILGRYLEN